MLKTTSRHLLFFLSFLVAASLAAVPSYQEIEDKNTLSLLTPTLQNIQTAKIRLSNDLEAYLISDPEARQSAAALSVGVGSWEDPDSLPGTAHFLEHMLFLGTTKYPKESGFSAFITEHGGVNNAYTASTHTNYHFSVNHDGFEEALDRFSWFFKEPLFTPSGVDREMQAVDQEFAKNLEDDAWRQTYVQKALANPQHPYSRFQAGNLETLQAISQEELQEWYREHYSANLMKLVVYSPLPLDQLKALVSEDFSEIPNQSKSRLSLDTPMLSHSRQGHLTSVVPIKDLKRLVFTWELPKKFAHMLRQQPQEVVSHILGHEGPESLLAQLKREELAEGLSAGGSPYGPDNFLFQITVHLTDKGLKKRELVMERLFQALSQFKKRGVPDYLFQEVVELSTLNYQYQTRKEPFDLVTAHAAALQTESLETYPMLTLVPQEFSPQSIKEMMEHLSPQAAYYTVIASPSSSGLASDRTEKWVGVKYGLRSMDEELLNRWSFTEPHAAIDLPPPNPFIPQSLAVLGKREESGQTPLPDLLVNDDLARIYYGMDQWYEVAKIYWNFEIKVPSITPKDPTSLVLGDLFVKSVQEHANDIAYNALLAGLNYQFERTSSGISLHLSGYSDRAPQLFQHLIKALTRVQPTKKQFKLYKEALKRAYKNQSKASPLDQSIEELRSILYDHYPLAKEKARVLSKIDFDDFELFRKSLFSRSYVEGLLYGNLTKEEAKARWRELRMELASQSYPREEHEKPSVIQLPAEQGPFFVQTKTKQRGNAVLLMLEHGPFSYRRKAEVELLSTLLQEPFFDDLRTKQQTAYLVFNSHTEVENYLYSYFAVQSDSHDARDLLARFELSIEQSLQRFISNPEARERFERIRKATIDRLAQTPENLNAMGTLLHTLAYKYEGAFDRIEKRIQGLDSLQWEDFLEFALSQYGATNKSRIAVLKEGVIENPSPMRYKKIRSIKQLKKISDYRTRRGLTSAVNL